MIYRSAFAIILSLLITSTYLAADTVPPTAPAGLKIGPQSPGSTTVSAKVCTGVRTGGGLVSSGFFLRPGDLSDADFLARKFLLRVNGQEKAIYAEPLRGRFPNGTIRSVLVQFDENIASTNTCLPAEIQFGGATARTTTDIAKRTITDPVLRDQRVLVATSPVYLSETWATFQPLLPAANENATNTAYFSTFFDQRFEALKDVELTAGAYGGATYESTRALAAGWQKTGNTKYYFNAYIRALSLLQGYSLPNATVDAQHFVPRINPQNWPGANHPGFPAEWTSQRYLGFAWAYLATGAVEYWNAINVLTQLAKYRAQTQQQAVALNGWISSNYIGRFNIRHAWSFALGPVIDVTHPTANGSAYGQGRLIDYPQELPWLLDAWEANRFTANDYRQGLRGTAPSSTNGGTLNPGEVPHFQVALLSDLLVFYYLNVKTDPRAADWACKNAEIVWDNNVIPLLAGEAAFPAATHGLHYMMTSQSGRIPGQGASSYTLPMWASTLAFCNHYRGDAKFNTYYLLSINPGNVAPNRLIWSWKLFGELFGNLMSAPYFNQNGIPTGLPTTIRTPTNY